MYAAVPSVSFTALLYCYTQGPDTMCGSHKYCYRCVNNRKTQYYYDSIKLSSPRKNRSRAVCRFAEKIVKDII